MDGHTWPPAVPLWTPGTIYIPTGCLGTSRGGGTRHLHPETGNKKSFLSRVLFFFFLLYWDLNSGPTLEPLPPTLFFCVCDGFFTIGS
jgi:hypothetical protein